MNKTGKMRNLLSQAAQCQGTQRRRRSEGGEDVSTVRC